MSRPLVILGAGITGLAAAAMAGEKGVDYLLLEAEAQVGGLTRSISVNGYTFDHTGHLLHLARHATPNQLCKSLNDDEWNLLTRHAKCYYGGMLIDAPIQYNLGSLPEQRKAQFWNDYLSAKHAADSPIGTCDFQSYLQRHFGESLANEYLIPLNKKTLATDLKRISAEAVTRFFPGPDEQRMRNGLAARKERGGNDGTYNAKFWYPQFGGMQKLVNGLAEEVDHSKVRLSTRVLDVDLRHRVIVTNRGAVPYKGLLSSLPLRYLLSLEGMKEIAHQTEWEHDVTCSSVLCVDLGFKGKLPCELETVHWVYFGQPQFSFYRLGVYSNFSDAMVPKERSSYYVEVGLPVGEVQSGSRLRLLAQVIHELEEVGWITPENIEVVMLHTIAYGYVHYTFQRQHLLETLQGKLRSYGIWLCGRYGRWHYCSMEDSILDGRESVERLEW